MRKLTLVAAIAAVVATAACKKTGEGEYEVEKPVVGTQTDTVNTPSVDVNTKTDTITTPKVTTQKTEVKVPDVDVKSADENKKK
ncbi:MAG TPA: hypothetical protein VFS40_08915 [Gemmatimonadales bacterium]|nr:hypothetical protein [Gemmatimonadales bacterium]